MLTGGGCGRVTATTGHWSTHGGGRVKRWARVTPCWQACPGGPARVTDRQLADRLVRVRDRRSEPALDPQRQVRPCGSASRGTRPRPRRSAPPESTATCRTPAASRAAAPARGEPDRGGEPVGVDELAFVVAGWRRPPRARSRTTRSCRRSPPASPICPRATVTAASRSSPAASAATPMTPTGSRAAPRPSSRPRSRSRLRPSRRSRASSPLRLIEVSPTDSLLMSRTWPSLATPTTYASSPMLASGNGCSLGQPRGVGGLGGRPRDRRPGGGLPGQGRGERRGVDQQVDDPGLHIGGERDAQRTAPVIGAGGMAGAFQRDGMGHAAFRATGPSAASRCTLAGPRHHASWSARIRLPAARRITPRGHRGHRRPQFAARRVRPRWRRSRRRAGRRTGSLTTSAPR